MPRQSVWFIRLSLACLAVGFTLGFFIQANKGLAISPVYWLWLPVHIELLLTGWLALLAAGVAYWILPRLPGPSPRGDERLAWLALALLITGIALVAIDAFSSLPALSWIGRGFEILGVLAFISGAWPRVKAFGT